MEEYQERVVAEKAELDAKMMKLTDFIDSVRFNALPMADRCLLREQKLAMKRYSDILGERIAGFKIVELEK